MVDQQLELQKTWEFKINTHLFMGVNSISKVDDAINKVSPESNKVLIITDEYIASTDIISRICSILKSSQIQFEIFDRVILNPTDKGVNEAFNFMKSNKCNVLLAVGGGSSIDTAKAVGVLATNGGDIRDYYGGDKVKQPLLPLVAIPTTAGTGSEVSPAAMIGDTSKKKLKFSIRSELICPKAAILDPTVLASLPFRTAAATSMDALTHAIEAFVSLWSSPFTEAISLSAIKLIGHYVRPFAANPANIEAASAMMYASTMAGNAFNYARLGNVHCMSRHLEAKYPLAHGLACALLLPHVIRFNAIACPQKFAQIACVIEEGVKGLPDLEAAKELEKIIQRLNTDLMLPESLREIGVDEGAIAELASSCAEMPYNLWNPRFTTHDDFINIFKSAL